MTLIEKMEELGVAVDNKQDRGGHRIVEEAYRSNQIIHPSSKINIDDISVQSQNSDERELLEHMIVVATGHLARLKTRLNMLVPINKLPVELLIHILLLAKPCITKRKYPYVSYMGVCHHWQTVIIQTPNFWTLVQHVPLLFFHEILRRSKSARLDVIIRDDPPEFLSVLENLFTKQGSRIRTLRLHGNGSAESLTRLILSNGHFPSLRVFVLDRSSNPCEIFIQLLPVLVSSDHLETLDCILNITNGIRLDQLAQIFSRLKNLRLELHPQTAPASVESLLFLLCGNTKLQTLRLMAAPCVSFSSGTGHCIILPELRFLSASQIPLLKYFRAPKLSCLDTAMGRYSIITPDCSILEDYNFSSMRCLYVLGPPNQFSPAHFSRYSILALKRRLHYEFFSSTNTDEHSFNYGIDPEGFFRFDIDSNTIPSEYFRLQLHREEFTDFLKPGLSWLLPRLTSLTELYFLPGIQPHHAFCLKNIMTHIFSVQKLIIEHDNSLLDFIHILNNTSLVPRLRYLCYATTTRLNNPENYAEIIGRSLAECLQSRQKVSAHKLQFIAFGGNCPPLSETWLNELRKLGTKVVIVESRMVFQYVPGFD
ncbi:hypothetical protein Clacol_010309 [Clathrus columnatus]|uniref:F-box domain-containing protein n=1 Tax=Clathrus columnatus TaxID=1419009 RepID=A0AAV5AVW4_9AGAM|nr:hypothetical protein Clacol_010309 [Clathrus columnatus]